MRPPADHSNEELRARIDALPGVPRLREVADAPLYLVGGTVRDLLLGADRLDLDVAVEGDVEPLAGRLGGEVRAHERFETASIALDGGHVDLARTRTENYERPGALPEVSPAPLADDLARRDFTVNAMAIPLGGEPELIDPHDGATDLDARSLRVLHERSFEDDPTRALRAARYAARLGFALDTESEKLARAADLKTVSEDRVHAELRRLAAEPNARRGFELLDEWGLIELPAGAGEHIDALTGLLASQPWANVTDLPEAVLAEALDRNGERERLASVKPGCPSEAVALASGRDGVELALARVRGAEWLDRYVTEWRDVGLEITGEDLLAEGVEEGPAVGKGLDAALARKLDGKLSGRDEELAAALEASRE